MKIKILENQLKNIILENIDHDDDFHSLMFSVTYNIFMSIKNKKKIFFDLIKPLEYKRALEEYMKYGMFVRFPENKILDWKELVLTNIAMLDALTSIHGHSQYFPFDEFYDVFDNLKIPKKHKYDWTYVYNILDKKYKIDDYVPFFSNGHTVLSDYGIEPLFKLAYVLIRQTKPEDIIITINKIMNVAHQRSDLSELFIEGGEKSHHMISNT